MNWSEDLMYVAGIKLKCKKDSIAEESSLILELLGIEEELTIVG